MHSALNRASNPEENQTCKRMPRLPKDQKLAEIARSMKDINLPDPDGAMEQLVNDIRQDRPFKGVYVLPDFKTYQVRVTLGGTQVTVAYHKDVAQAVRLHDAWMLRFKKYRLRGSPIVNDSDLNIPMVWAERDHAIPEVTAWLLTLEAHFLDLKLISKDAGDLYQVRAARKKELNTRKTVRGELMRNHLELLERFNKTDATIEKLRRGLSVLFEKVDQLSRLHGGTLAKLPVDPAEDMRYDQKPAHYGQAAGEEESEGLSPAYSGPEVVEAGTGVPEPCADEKDGDAQIIAAFGSKALFASAPRVD